MDDANTVSGTNTGLLIRSQNTSGGKSMSTHIGFQKRTFSTERGRCQTMAFEKCIDANVE